MFDADVDNADTGTHLKFKFQANSHILCNELLMRQFLTIMVEEIGARPLCEPIVENVVFNLKKQGVDPYFDEGGISGIIMLSVSHIACHTWPKHDGKKVTDEQGDAVCDVYSCRPFDPDKAEKVIREIYRPSRLQIADFSEALVWGD
jgi:S-adenosylmethionine/arginine decarboxylase-like enzyme